MCDGMSGSRPGWSRRLLSGGPNPIMGLGERAMCPRAQRKGCWDRTMVGKMGWRLGRQGTQPFHCLCLPTAPPLAGGTPAGGTGRLLVSVQGVSWEHV
jgi:hypothetical protein